jgi:hypothetical protein
MLNEKGFNPQKFGWRKTHDESLQGGVGGASEIRRSMGTAAVDMMANTRILKVACHVDILATVN